MRYETGLLISTAAVVYWFAWFGLIRIFPGNAVIFWSVFIVPLALVLLGNRIGGAPEAGPD
jgi:hypothetical protein